MSPFLPVDGQPLAPQFITTGTLDAPYAWLDRIFQQFMQMHHIRAGVFAAVRGSTVLANRGYTLALHGYPITQPTSRFRLASVSKQLTCAALTRLVETGQVSWTTPAFPLLGITQPLIGMARQPGLDSITVGELVDHKARLERGIDNRAIALARGQAFPPARNELVYYLYGLPRLPQFMDGGVPVVRSVYSNFGYVVLTSVVEHVAGKPFVHFLRDAILAPLGLADVWVGGTTKADALPSEVTYDDDGTGPSQLTPTLPAQIPLAYGGQFILENSEGAGGLVSTALTIAHLSSSYAVWGRGHRMADFTRYGNFAGTWAGAHSLPNGIDFAFMFNHTVPEDVQDTFNWHLAQILDPANHPQPHPRVGWTVHES